MHIATWMTLQRTMLSRENPIPRGLKMHVSHLYSVPDSNGEQISDCQELKKRAGVGGGNGCDYERAT